MASELERSEGTVVAYFIPDLLFWSLHLGVYEEDKLERTEGTVVAYLKGELLFWNLSVGVYEEHKSHSKDT